MPPHTTSALKNPFVAFRIGRAGHDSSDAAATGDVQVVRIGAERSSPAATCAAPRLVLLDAPGPGVAVLDAARPVGATAYTLQGGRQCRARTDDEWDALTTATLEAARTARAAQVRIGVVVAWGSVWHNALAPATGDAASAQRTRSLLASLAPCDVVWAVSEQAPFGRDTQAGLALTEEVAALAQGMLFARQVTLWGGAPALGVCVQDAALWQRTGTRALGLNFAPADPADDDESYHRACDAAQAAGLAGLLYGAP